LQPNYISISTLFSAQTRHTIPLFQRPYVWTRDDQWEPLWEDIAGLLERLEDRVGDAPVASHFLGTIVLEQVQNVTGSLPRREVIDGQQRLTTLQIVLKAAEHALHDAAAMANGDATKINLAMRQIASLTENLAEGVERYKVWPTNEDREPFQTVIDAVPTNGVDGDGGRMADAYRYFRDVFAAYLSGNEPAQRAQRFAAALKDYLKLIVLDLDPNDEPQAIFETLNAHGTPLLPADLIKNWLLWEAARQKLDPVPLYEKYWRPFDREHAYWRARVGTGHAARARVDTFLQNWLAKETDEIVSAKHLYDRFLRHIAKLKASSPTGRIDVEVFMRGIRHDADRFERIDKPSDVTRFDLFLQRLKAMDLIVFQPLLLGVMARLEGDPQDLDRVGMVLESYLVRRMICAYQTRGYGALALRLHKILADAPEGVLLAGLLKEQLLSETGTDAWPNDEQFRLEWLRRRFYGGLRRERVVMVLRAMEHFYQSNAHLAEPLMTFDWSKLQIEHILPQSWHKHWPLADGVTPEQRELSLHGIGNLTLVAGKLNPSLSNAAWRYPEAKGGKSEALRKHTRLELNRRLLQNHDTWDEASIAARADALFQDAVSIWRR
jgi:hypothetical protein